MEGRRITLPVNHSVNHQQKGIWGILLYFVFWSSFCLGKIFFLNSVATDRFINSVHFVNDIVLFFVFLKQFEKIKDQIVLK